MERPTFKDYTTMRIGGEFKQIFFPNTVDKLCDFIKQTKEKYIVIGNGSNFIPSDEYFDGVVISLKKMKLDLEISNDIQKVPSSISMPKLANILAENNLDAFFLSSIPGTIGGGVYMNASSYNHAISDYFIKGEFINEQGEYLELTKEELQFGYRKSLLQEEPLILIYAYFSFPKCENIREKITKYQVIRRRTQPLNCLNSGSVFKNPESTYAWQLIDSCGLRGFKIGDAKISEKHANFIVNEGNATAQDIFDLHNYVKEKVFEKTGTLLESEWVFFNW